MEIKGINTAPIKQGERLFVMTFKVRDNADNERILFMQMSTLVDFMIILKNRMAKLSQRVQERGENYRAALFPAVESLTKNIPQFIEEEVTQPDTGNLVMSIAPKFDDEGFTLVAALNNQHVVTLKIDDAQVEFIMVAIIKAIEASNDKEASQMIGSMLDFIMLYNVDLADPENLRYLEVKHEPWKESLFAHHFAALYCFNTEKGKQILAGVVIKTDAQPNSPEAKNVIERVAMLTPAIRDIQGKYPLCDVFSRIIPAQPSEILPKEHCLKTLQGFCLKMQGDLNH